MEDGNKRLFRNVAKITWCFTCSVLSVSSTDAGETAQIIAVFAFPPSEVCRMRVSFESRNGTNVLKETERESIIAITLIVIECYYNYIHKVSKYCIKPHSI